jgi:Outer membrane protein beta-barrel domain
MVRYLFVLLVVMAFAAPAFAQDVPQLELGFGYGNFEMKELFPNRANGFTTRQTINLNSIFSIENYLGFYWFGKQPTFGNTKTELISEHIGGRVNYRNLGPVIYGSASIGGGFLRFPQLGVGESSFGFKYGGGVDIPFKEFFAWNIDVSRMSYGFFGDALDGRVGGLNISTGIVIKMGE